MSEPQTQTLSLETYEKIMKAIQKGYRKTVNLLFHGRDVDPTKPYDDVYGTDGAATVAAMAGTIVNEIVPGTGVYEDKNGRIWVYNREITAAETFLLLLALNRASSEERETIAKVVELLKNKHKDDP